MIDLPDTIVSVEWLRARLGTPGLRVLDGSFKMPGVTPTAAADYGRDHIQGAVFFDIDAISDHASTLPHMLPPPDQFAAQIGALGIGNDDAIVVYDATGLAGATRVWWTFRVFGHERIAVLDGGLRRWKALGGPTDATPVEAQPMAFHARHDAGLVRDRDAILADLATRAEQVLDARAAARFAGLAPEPWPGRRLGHIPGSRNLDHTLLVDPASLCLKPVEALLPLFQAAGIDLARPIVTSCGSGITATVLALALHRLGHRRAAVYDGSWSDWGLPGDLPIAVGPT